MKNCQVIMFIVAGVLLACASPESTPKQTSHATTSQDAQDIKAENLTKEQIEPGTARYDYRHVFSDASVEQTLYIKKGVVNKKRQVPEKIEFKLSLHDKLGRHPDKRIAGTGLLASAEETFSEKNGTEGDYAAADYVFNTEGCRLKIRLDVEGYAACVVSTTCAALKDFFKSYPDYDVLKRVNHQN